MMPPRKNFNFNFYKLASVAISATHKKCSKNTSTQDLCNAYKKLNCNLQEDELSPTKCVPKYRALIRIIIFCLCENYECSILIVWWVIYKFQVMQWPMKSSDCRLCTLVGYQPNLVGLCPIKPSCRYTTSIT